MANQDKRHGRIFLLGIIGFILILTLAGLVMPGPYRLGELTDVSFVALTDGQVLTYDVASGNWTNGYVNGTAVNMTLNQLSDVVLSSIQNNQIIQYNSTSLMWENRDPSSSDVYAVANLTDVSVVGLSDGQLLRYNGTSLLWENSAETTWSISTLTDVALNGLGDLQILQYNATSGKWENRAIPAQALAGLTDVSITSLSNNQILQYNSTSGKWENMNLQTWAISTLTDVSIVGLSNGQLLKYNSTSARWENMNENSYAVSNLTDVTLLGLSDSQVLTYNSTLGKWESRGLPQSFPYGNLTGVPQTFPYGNLTGVPNLTDGLFLWLQGENFYDYSGLMHHGVNNGVLLESGKFGGGFYSPSSPSNINFGDINETDYVSALSISFWFKAYDLNNRGVMAKSVGGGSSENVFVVYLIADEVWFYVFGDSTASTHASVLVNQWYFCYCEYNGTGISIYLDNVFKNSAVAPSRLNDSNQTLFVGKYVWGVDNWCYYGLLDDVRFYSRALSGAEISALYNLP